MTRTHSFATTGRYGYYAYIEDGMLVVGEDWPREGGDIFRNTYANAKGILELLQKEDRKLYNRIVAYYTEHPEVTPVDPIKQVEKKLKEDLQELAANYRNIADVAYSQAIIADTEEECLKCKEDYEFYRKLSETYRLMSLGATDYADQYKDA